MQDCDASSLSEQIAQQIATKIILGDWVEGERIQELRLAKELNVSRGSVREALLILARTQLIEIYPRRGAIVAEMSATQVNQLFEMSSLVLTKMVERMSEHWQGYHFTQLKQLLKVLHEHCQQGNTERFYDLIFEELLNLSHIANNSYLLQSYKDLMPALRRCYFLILNLSKQTLKEAFDLFKSVVDAILNRNVQQATLFMHEFCRHLRNLVLESLTRMKQIELAWARRSRH